MLIPLIAIIIYLFSNIILYSIVRFQAIRRLNSGFHYLVITLLLLGHRQFMYIDMAMHTNKDLWRIRMFLLVSLPLILGSALGYAIFTVSKTEEVASTIIITGQLSKDPHGFLHTDTAVFVVKSVIAWSLWNYRYL